MTDPKKSTVITSHINADFDALASMLAAQKLYPDSLVVFPGSQEKNLRNFFIQSMVYLLNIASVKEIDVDKIERLVLVDTKQPHRIGKFESILNRPDLEIHIYDHHPPMENDIEGQIVVQEPVGATVTLLTEILNKKNIDITPDEATIMCLGIYEDTGSFTFPSTTEKDFRAAAFLLSKGANLNMISNLISREISPEQVAILNDMIQASTSYHINGIEVIFTSVTTDQYVPDFAFLVHKMVKMEDIEAIFAIAQMENKVYIVARSRIPEVDVGDIVTSLGGGGHTYAAAASIKDKTITQIEQALLELLFDKVESRRLAKHLMSSPAIMIDEEVSCKDAAELLTRYNINAVLVTKKGSRTLSGIISRQIIEKALYHKLHDVPVREYMTTEMVSVAPTADILEIQENIIESKQRILPVIDQENIVGVVTRTDLLNVLVSQQKVDDRSTIRQSQQQIRARKRNILNFMKERLSQKRLSLLKDIGRVADEIDCAAYVVGGFVRDLFLYRSNEDIDVVIEGDGIAFAKKFAAEAGARIHAYAKFGTAVIIFPDGFKIDVASARLEYYKFPAALPIVEMSSIRLDLFRRDFTMNTLAIQLNADKFSTLIDFFSAQRDIKEKVIRVLHNLSFVEDPTRVFRALRFEQRFGFTIGKLTAGLIENAVKMDFFKRLSGRRIFTEVRLILEEENPTPAIVRLHDYQLLQVVHPSIGLDKNLISLLNSTQEVLAWHDLLFLEESYIKWAIYFMVLIQHCDQQTTREICDRLELAPRYRKILLKDRFTAESIQNRMERDLPKNDSSLHGQLTGLSIEMILYMMVCARSRKVKRAISHYVTKLRQVRISVTGKDLMERGLKPGPLFRDIMQAVLNTKLNGLVQTREDELAFVEKYISKQILGSKGPSTGLLL
ncbi:MAG: CBS domain-containing protein [Desulfobacterales bacterium]|nr:CBS domain-containing protein [Desulfobacterales bacterium]MDX2511735.1 CBS domain-containing protein [Desulfobacterales bacterium]